MSRQVNQSEVERVWRDFWADIVMPDGDLDVEQIKKELYDFRQVMKEVPNVYDHVTGGKISKITTKAFEVILASDDHVETLIDEIIQDINLGSP